MELISSVEISGFRSIRSCEIKPIGDFTAIAGLNNAGKSNVLKALNAFFSGETDPGTALSVDADYFRPDRRKKKKKRIRITVGFELPQYFKFRKGYEDVEQLLPSRAFRVGKEWELNEPAARYILDEKALDLGEGIKLDKFLQMINFRYVPNRVLPLEIIRQNATALRTALVRRMRSRIQGSDNLFTELRNTSSRLISPIVERFAQYSPSESNLRLATPDSLDDLVFALGYRIAEGEMEVADELQGSGIQSLLMLETLALIDRDFYQQFGWRQASIWAIEEPESSLHASLEANMATYLLSLATEKSGRLQVLATTHSDLMLQYARKQVIVEKGAGGESEVRIPSSTRDAVAISAHLGASRWVHPILQNPLDPIILVEGKHDHDFLVEALRAMDVRRAPRICYLEMLRTSGATGGKDDVLSYMKNQFEVICARDPKAPLLVLLDWDARSKVATFERLFAGHDHLLARAWPDGALNPRCGKSFRGIERACPDRFFEEVIRAGGAIAKTPNGKWVVESDEFGRIKRMFHAMTLNGLARADIAHAEGFINDLLAAISGRSEELPLFGG